MGNGSYNTLTKYCTINSFGYNGFVDNKTELDPEDDAAYVIWGPSWRMPTKEQRDELREKCAWSRTTQNGVDGRLVTGPNGNTLFLPHAGCRWYDFVSSAGSWCGSWTRTIISSDPYDAAYLYPDCGFAGWFAGNRASGFPVRAVRVP